MEKWQKGEQGSQRGAVLVFVALMLPMLIFLGGMALDFGRAYLYQSAIQNAADSAALAGVAAAANSAGKARLISKEDMPLPINVADQEATTVATTVATHVLQKDMEGSQASNTKLFVTTTGEPADPKPDAYYYRVEMSGNVALRFARIFLPDSLLPEGFPVKVQAIAMAKVHEPPGTMLEQIKKLADEEFFNDFYDVEDIFLAQGYSKNEARIKAKQVSFTNKGILYHADGTRSEVFNMDGNAEFNNDMKSLFVNYKADVQPINAAHAFNQNWDVSDMWNLTAQEARNFFYDENGVASIKFTNWLLYDENPSDDPYVNGPHEGATITWDQFFRSYVGKGKKYETEEEALRVLTSRISSIVNVTNAYRVRDNLETRPEDEVYIDADGNRNMQDPLFVRLESEEFNKTKGSYVTNSVRKIIINIKANNMADIYRPMLFLYAGPADVDGNYGIGRKSQVVTVNLEEDFKGAIYAPNSPVYINGNGHEFRGVIVAQSIVDSAGNEIPMPEELNGSNVDYFQTFYQRLNLSDATYDDFGVIKLSNYKSIRKDVVFLTERASVTM